MNHSHQLSRRNFVSLACASAPAMVVVPSLPGCSTAGGSLSDQHIAQVLGDYLFVGSDHRDLIQDFIQDLRSSAHTTAGPEETALILSGAKGPGAAERYVIQEFVRFSNYRLWLRRRDQTLGPSVVSPHGPDLEALENWALLNDLPAQ